MRRLGIVLLLLGAACQDKAKADYDRCVDLDKNYDAKGAAAACSAAVAADPNSPSGLAAAKKLLDLQSVSEKLNAESADKAARMASLKKDEPELLVQPAPSASAVATAAPTLAADAGPEDVVAFAQALYAGGDADGARKVLDPRVLSRKAKPTSAEIKLLADVCKAQQDAKCSTAVAAVARKHR